MKFKNIIAVSLLMILLSCTGSKPHSSSHSLRKPNILFILVDDYGWRDLSINGSTFYETPNMDKLFRKGMMFTEAYASYPRCVPSRYSIMTGSHPARQGQDDSGVLGFHIKAPNVSIGTAMKNSGYNTFYIGKWHLGSDEYAPANQGFDASFAAGRAGGISSHFAPYNKNYSGTAGVPEAETAPVPDMDDAPEGECLEDRLTAQTINYLKTFSTKPEPFFGILAHYAVHTPLEGKPEYVAYFEEKLKKQSLTGPDYEKESAGENKLKQDNARYAAMIRSVDDGIGRIMQALEDLGLADNTVIILTSDHGGLSARGNNRELATSNRPFRAGKGHIYEGGLRVPMAVVWNGVIKPGTHTKAPVHGTDHFPTLLEIAGGKIPGSQILDGKSYFGILKGDTPNFQRSLFWHNPAPRPYATGDIYSSAIRMGNYKLYDFFAEKRLELYNLEEDEEESINLSATKPELTESLYKQLAEWRTSVGAYMQVTPRGLGTNRNAGKQN